MMLSRERGEWRVSGAYTQPVQTRDVRAFDDYSNHHLTFSGGRVQRRWSGSTQLSASYSNLVTMTLYLRA